MKRSFLSTVALALWGLSLGACVSSVPPGDQGRALYNGGNYLAAADAFADDIRLYPRSVAAWNNRGVARVRLGDLSGAISDYNRAIQLAPDDAELYFNRGNALVASGLYQEAIMDYSRAIQLNPAYTRAIFNRGTAYALAGQPDLARRDWLAAIEQEPDPYAKSAMLRSAGLAPRPTAVATPPPPVGQPTTAYTIAPPQPAASPMALDSRALTTRAISRELDGDHAGAMQDLNAAVAIEPDTARREAIIKIIRLLDTPR